MGHSDHATIFHDEDGQMNQHQEFLDGTGILNSDSKKSLFTTIPTSALEKLNTQIQNLKKLSKIAQENNSSQNDGSNNNFSKIDNSQLTIILLSGFIFLGLVIILIYVGLQQKLCHTMMQCIRFNFQNKNQRNVRPPSFERRHSTRRSKLSQPYLTKRRSHA